MEDYCVACGAIVPEGRMVCPMCEAKYFEKKPQNPSQRSADCWVVESEARTRWRKTPPTRGRERESK